MIRLQKYKKIIAFLLVGVIIIFNASSTYVHASGVVSGATTALENAGNALVKCFLSVNGVVSRSNLGGLSGVSNSVQTSLLNEVQNQVGLGNIYESDGRIFYNKTAMDALYDLLDSNVNARVISDFSKYNLYAPEVYSGYVTSAYLGYVNDILTILKNSNKPYLLHTYGYSYFSNGKQIVKIGFWGYELNEYTAFLLIPSTGVPFYFKDSNNQNVTQNLYWTSVTWEGNTSTVRKDITNLTSNQFTFNRDDNLQSDFYNNLYYSLPDAYFLYQGSRNTDYYNEIYCTDPFVIAQSSQGANTVVNKTSGNYFFNNYETYEIDSNTFYNNDWTKIYNSYSTNVTNQYDTYIENNENITTQDIYDIMDTYVQSIYIGIEDGDTDIAQKVDYINEWLSKIYENTNNMITGIDELITAVTSGGSACLWTQEEIDIVLDKLSLIYTEQVDNDLEIQAALIYLKDKITAIKNTADTVNNTLTSVNSNSGIIVDSLDTELSRLATIMTKLDTIISKMGGAHSVDLPSMDPSLTVDLDDILDSDLLEDVFQPFNLAAQLITTVVPVCYLFTAVAILNTLKAPPMTPSWSVPISLERFGIEEDFVINLEDFDTLAGFIRTFILISFAIGLCFFSINLIRNILQIIS